MSFLYEIQFRNIVSYVCFISTTNLDLMAGNTKMNTSNTYPRHNILDDYGYSLLALFCFDVSLRIYLDPGRRAPDRDRPRYSDRERAPPSSPDPVLSPREIVKKVYVEHPVEVLPQESILHALNRFSRSRIAAVTHSGLQSDAG